MGKAKKTVVGPIIWAKNTVSGLIGYCSDGDLQKAISTTERLLEMLKAQEKKRASSPRKNAEFEPAFILHTSEEMPAPGTWFDIPDSWKARLGKP